MKVFAALPLLCATLISARSLLQGSQQALAASYPVPGDSPLEFCADPKGYWGTIDYVNLTPNPPLPGENLHISVNGTLDKEIGEGAKVHLVVKIGEYITILNQVSSLCDNLPKIGKECPLEAGTLSVERDAAIPAFVPPATYNVLAQVYSAKGEEVVCLKASVTFSPS